MEGEWRHGGRDGDDDDGGGGISACIVRETESE